MMNENDWNDFYLSFDEVRVDDATDDELTLYRVGESDKIFAAIEKDSKPIRLSLRCDRLLAKTLRERFETIFAAAKFDPTTWNTVIATGQLDDEELKDLSRLSYNLTRDS